MRNCSNVHTQPILLGEIVILSDMFLQDLYVCKTHAN